MDMDTMTLRAASMIFKDDTAVAHIPTEIYQEIASYLHKADVDNLRLTCTTASNIYLTDHPNQWMIYKPTHPVWLIVNITVGYYRRISSYICDGDLPIKGRHMTIKSLYIRGGKFVNMSDLERFANIEYLRLSRFIYYDLRGRTVVWPNLKTLVYDGEDCNATGASMIYKHAPSLTHLYIRGIYLSHHSGDEFRPDAHPNPNLCVLHTRGPIVPSRIPQSLRVLSITGTNSPFYCHGKMPSVTTFIGTTDEPTGILSFVPMATEIIVPMGDMIIPLPTGHMVRRLVVRRIGASITEASLAGVDVTVTHNKRIDDYDSVDAILRR